MALSQSRTPLAKLRAIIGPVYGQEKNFAKTIGLSVSFVKKASCGIRHMTKEAAEKIAVETGASPRWLLGELAKPASDEGEPFSKLVYEQRRHWRKIGMGPDVFVSVGVLLANCLTACEAASIHGTLPFAMHKFGEVIKEFFKLHNIKEPSNLLAGNCSHFQEKLGGNVILRNGYATMWDPVKLNADGSLPLDETGCPIPVTPPPTPATGNPSLAARRAEFKRLLALSGEREAGPGGRQLR